MKRDPDRHSKRIPMFRVWSHGHLVGAYRDEDVAAAMAEQHHGIVWDTQHKRVAFRYTPITADLPSAVDLLEASL